MNNLIWEKLAIQFSSLEMSNIFHSYANSFNN